MSDSVSAIVKLAEDSLAEKDAEIKSKVGNLLVERDELAAFIKKATRGSSNGSAPATSEEDLIAAVGHSSKSGPAKTTDIAKFLSVDARTIARRLPALVEAGKISGNKEDGYAA